MSTWSSRASRGDVAVAHRAHVDDPIERTGDPPAHRVIDRRTEVEGEHLEPAAVVQLEKLRHQLHRCVIAELGREVAETDLRPSRSRRDRTERRKRRKFPRRVGRGDRALHGGGARQGKAVERNAGLLAPTDSRMELRELRRHPGPVAGSQARKQEPREDEFQSRGQRKRLLEARIRLGFAAHRQQQIAAQVVGLRQRGVQSDPALDALERCAVCPRCCRAAPRLTCASA